MDIPDHAEDQHTEQMIRQKCYKFTQWCSQVGILYPKLTYPAFFEGGLVGVRVQKPILPGEAFLHVPLSQTISVNDCLSELADYFTHSMFKPPHRDWEQLILCVYLMHHKQLGAQSKWHAMIEAMPQVMFFCDWPIDAIMSTQDPYLISQSIMYKEDLNSNYEELPLPFTKEQFMQSFAQVVTRDFGWYMPSTSLIPMADNFNHSNVNIKTFLTGELYKQHCVSITEPNYIEDNDTDSESVCPEIDATGIEDLILSIETLGKKVNCLRPFVKKTKKMKKAQADVFNGKDGYFSYVNMSDKVLQPGDQVFYNYGNRTNRFLILNYGFCYENNPFDSFEFQIDVMATSIETLIQFIDSEELYTHTIRLKKGVVNKDLLYFCNFSKFSYQQVIGYLLENLKETAMPEQWEFKMAWVYRKERRAILISQSLLFNQI